MNTRHEFVRFKYAEEFAHEIDKRWPRQSFKMYRAKDQEYEEDGETYTAPCYVVEVHYEQ